MYAQSILDYIVSRKNGINIIRANYGDSISQIFSRAMCVAEATGGISEFVFNDITIRIDKSSNFPEMWRDYERAQEEFIKSPIGPKYPYQLPDETVKYEKERRRRRQISGSLKRRHEKILEEKECNKIREELALCPVMSFKDKESEDYFKKGLEYRDVMDGLKITYTAGIFEIARDIARLLEYHIDAGEKLTRELVSEIGEKAATLHGPSGYQFLTAENLVSQFWKYGNEYYPFSHRGQKELKGA